MATLNGINIVEDNTGQVLSELEKASARALESIGIHAEKYAKALCPVGTTESTGKKGYRGGTLRNSITHSVDAGNKTVTIGSNVEYAPYVELGTGPNFTPPPEWEQINVPKGSGMGHAYVHPRPYLRPAIQDHLDEYKNISNSELS